MAKSKPQIDAGMAHSWDHCPRRLWYDVKLPKEEKPEKDAFERLIAEAGLNHEKKILSSLPDHTEAKSAAHTAELIKNKTPIIYQPIFKNPELNIVGKPDFLILKEDGNYEIADAKLAISITNKKAIKLQLGVYLKLFPTALPAMVYLGNGKSDIVTEKIIPKAELFITEVAEILSSDKAPETHFSDSKCKACPYDSICRPAFIAEEEITLSPSIEVRSAQGLKEQGYTTLTKLAAADPEDILDVPYLGGQEKKLRAIKQAQSLLTGEVFQLSPLEIPKGTWIHFDVESNPLAKSTDVYLWGWLEAPYDDNSFEYTWSTGSEESDKSAWLEFLEKMDGLRKQYAEELVLIHFSPYEVTQIKAYAQKYEMTEDPTVSWLLGDDSPLFDLLPAIKKSLVLPVYGYGLKNICKDPRLVNFQWELSESGSQWSVVRYIDYLKSCDRCDKESEEIKEEILSYNRDDVKATRALELWLRNNFPSN